MNPQRQGSICLLLGLFALSGYVLLEQRIGSPPGFTSRGITSVRTASPTSFQALTESAGVGRVRQYQGRLIRRTVTGTVHYDWLVKVFDLPAQANGLRPLVVHSQQSPRSGWSWFDSPPPQRERSLVAWLDQRGEVVQQFLPPGEASRLDPLDWLFHQQNPTIGTAATVSEAATVSGERSMQMRIEGIRRRCKIDYDKDSKLAKRFSLEARQKSTTTNVSLTAALEIVDSSELSARTARQLLHDLDLWQTGWQATRAVTEIASLVGAKDEQEFDCLIKAYRAQMQELVNNSLHPATTIAIRQGLVEQGLIPNRLRSAIGVGQELLAHGPLRWATRDTTGERYDTAESSGQITVLGFVAFGAPEAAKMLDSMVTLQRRFGRERLNVIAFSTDYRGEDTRRMAMSLADEVPVLYGIPVASELNLYGAGMPALIITDSSGNARYLHAWQTHSDLQIVVRQIEGLRLEEKFRASDLVEQFSKRAGLLALSDQVGRLFHAAVN